MCVGTSLFSSAMQYGEIGAVLYSFIWDLKVWRSDSSLATHCYLWYPNSTKSLSLCNSLPLIPHHWNTESLAEDVLVLFGAVRSKYETVKSLVTKRDQIVVPFKIRNPFLPFGNYQREMTLKMRSIQTIQATLRSPMQYLGYSYLSSQMNLGSQINPRNKIWKFNLRDA